MSRIDESKHVKSEVVAEVVGEGKGSVSAL